MHKGVLNCHSHMYSNSNKTTMVKKLCKSKKLPVPKNYKPFGYYDIIKRRRKEYPSSQYIMLSEPVFSV